MGTQPAEVEQRIEQRRKRIGERISGLSNRIRSDAQEARQVVQHGASQAGQKAKKGLGLTFAISGTAAVLGIGYAAWHRMRSRKK